MFEIGRGSSITINSISKTKHGKYIYPVYSSQTLSEGLLGFYNNYQYKDSITWTTDGAKAGTVFHRKGLFYATSHCGILSKKQNTPNSFFANSLSRNIKKYVTWVAMPMLTTNTMSNLKILITKNVFEQNKISDLIDNINLLITLHQRKLETLKNMKNRLLNKMFANEKNQFPMIRFKEFTNAWEQEKVGNLFEIGRGSSITINSISKTKHGKYIYPVYSSQTLSEGLLGFYNNYQYKDSITWTTDGAKAGTVFHRKGLFSYVSQFKHKTKNILM